MRNQITPLQNALETRFFAPLRRPRTRRVGVELEFPIWNSKYGGAPSIEKEPVCATCSTSLERLLADPVEERTLIAHIRLATVGHIEYKNCHPFTAADNIGTWAPVPFTSLVSAKDGEIVRTSPPHGHEYIYNPEDYRLVYMNFARL